jgi:hypothetical protein
VRAAKEEESAELQYMYITRVAIDVPVEDDDAMQRARSSSGTDMHAQEQMPDEEGIVWRAG